MEWNLNEIQPPPHEQKKQQNILGTAGILEEGESSPKGVLRRKENDEPLIKGNSGYRTSPRISPVRTPKVSLTGKVLLAELLYCTDK